MLVAKRRSPVRLVSNFLYRHPFLFIMTLLLPPLAWFLILYISSLTALLQQSFYSVNQFTMLVEEEFTWQNYEALSEPANRDIIRRTVLMAAAVTITCAILGFFPAYYMARQASYRVKGLLYIGVMIPLWSSYLVRVYSWKLILAKEGVISWFFKKAHMSYVLEWILDRPVIGGNSLSVSTLGLFMVFVYIWLPYTILPIAAALERVPQSLVDASADLGAKPLYSFRTVILPLAFPGVVAGSIFTFSLTLGDYIIPSVIGNSSFYIGSAVSSLQSFNIPMAAAMTTVPLVVMLTYLMVARRLGAFDAL